MIKIWTAKCKIFLKRIELSLGVSTVESNRDRDRDVSIHRDVGFWNVEIESLDRDKDKTRDKLRLYNIEFVEMSFFKLSRKSRLSRCHFSNCQENLDCRDVIFQTVEKILTVQMSFSKLSRSRLSIETRSRQIETPTLKLNTFLLVWLK